MLNGENNSPISHDWVGLYTQEKDATSMGVVKGGYLKDFNFGPRHFTAQFI
jgi:hypothetical protein